MGATIEVSEEFREWLDERSTEGESPEATLRRLLAEPAPPGLADLLTEAEAARAAERYDGLQHTDRDRLEASGETFRDDGG